MYWGAFSSFTARSIALLTKSSGSSPRDIHLGSSLRRRGDFNGPKRDQPIWTVSLKDYLPEWCSRHCILKSVRTVDNGSYAPTYCLYSRGKWGGMPACASWHGLMGLQEVCMFISAERWSAGRQCKASQRMKPLRLDREFLGGVHTPGHRGPGEPCGSMGWFCQVWSKAKANEASSRAHFWGDMQFARWHRRRLKSATCVPIPGLNCNCSIAIHGGRARRMSRSDDTVNHVCNGEAGQVLSCPR